MDIKKLIEQLNGYFEGKELRRGSALDAATALSTFQAENEKLRAELEQKSKLIVERARGRVGVDEEWLSTSSERTLYKPQNMHGQKVLNHRNILSVSQLPTLRR